MFLYFFLFYVAHNALIFLEDFLDAFIFFFIDYHDTVHGVPEDAWGEDHRKNSEAHLRASVWMDISKANGNHGSDGKIESRDVLNVPVSINKVIVIPNPRFLDFILPNRYQVPDAGAPMSNTKY